MNSTQEKLFAQIKKSICDSVEPFPALKNAIGIRVPFRDINGAPLSIYITEDGRITDGGQTLNQIAALRVLEDFNYWHHKIDYFERYNIMQVRGSLEINSLDPSEGIISYLQGISRLPTFFEANPMASKEDRYPRHVRKIIADALVMEYPGRPNEGIVEWAWSLVQPNSFELQGITIHSDMSPINKNKNVQIISHASSSDSEKRIHVNSKLLNPLLLKDEQPKAETLIVMNDLEIYPEESQKLLAKKADKILELKVPSAKMELAEYLAKA